MLELWHSSCFYKMVLRIIWLRVTTFQTPKSSWQIELKCGVNKLNDEWGLQHWLWRITKLCRKMDLEGSGPRRQNHTTKARPESSPLTLPIPQCQKKFLEIIVNSGCRAAQSVELCLSRVVNAQWYAVNGPTMPYGKLPKEKWWCTSKLQT